MLSIRYFSVAAVVLAGLIAQGCGLGKTYREINPEAADLEVKKSNGYYSLKKVDPGTSKLVMRSEGMSVPVQFSVSTSPKACDAFSKPVAVVDLGRGVLLPSIAKMTKRGRKEFLDQQLIPQEPVQVRAYSEWSSSMGGGPNMPTTIQSGKCGPLVKRFTPQSDHAYVARLLFVDFRECSLVIEDASNPDMPVKVDAEEIPGCPAP